MNSVLNWSSQFVLLGICGLAIRRAFTSRSSGWFLYGLVAVLTLYAMAFLAIFPGDLPRPVAPALAATGGLVLWRVQRFCRRRPMVNTFHRRPDR